MDRPGGTQRPQRAALAAWAATLAATAMGIALLHTLGSHPGFAVDLANPWRWVGAHSAERVVLGLGRLAALGLGYWILGSLLIATAARATQVPGLIRSLDWMTLPAIRRLADRAVAVSLAVSSVTAGSAGTALAADEAAQEPDATPVVRVHQQSEPTPESTYIPVPAADAPLVPAPSEEEQEIAYTPVPAGQPTAGASPAVAAPSRVIDPASAEAGPRRLHQAAATYAHDVVPGDNLWSIAAGHLEQVLDRRTTDAETARYWAHLVETNRSRLRSGNPDLIYPGEIILCPATTDVGLAG